MASAAHAGGSLKGVAAVLVLVEVELLQLMSKARQAANEMRIIASKIWQQGSIKKDGCFECFIQ
jgi:hypothetical protein